MLESRQTAPNGVGSIGMAGPDPRWKFRFSTTFRASTPAICQVNLESHISPDCQTCLTELKRTVMAERLTGIFTPNLVPLDSRGEINESELRRYVDWLIKRGVHGLYPNGSTGEFTRFTVEERRRIVEIIADQVKGRVPILAGAAEANVKET